MGLLTRSTPRYRAGVIVDARGKRVTEVFRAENRRARLLGLRGLPHGAALLLPGEPVVHARGLAAPIDLVFITGDARVVAIVSDFRPGLRLSACLRSRSCLELPAGEVKQLGITIGGRLRFHPDDAA